MKSDETMKYDSNRLCVKKTLKFLHFFVLSFHTPILTLTRFAVLEFMGKSLSYRSLVTNRTQHSLNGFSFLKYIHDKLKRFMCVHKLNTLLSSTQYYILSNAQSKKHKIFAQMKHSLL